MSEHRNAGALPPFSTEASLFRRFMVSGSLWLANGQIGLTFDQDASAWSNQPKTFVKAASLKGRWIVHYKSELGHNTRAFGQVEPKFARDVGPHETSGGVRTIGGELK